MYPFHYTLYKIVGEVTGPLCPIMACRTRRRRRAENLLKAFRGLHHRPQAFRSSCVCPFGCKASEAELYAASRVYMEVEDEGEGRRSSRRLAEKCKYFRIEYYIY